eukprot:CAMPEP_0174262416 /NCGR_PEP_ID=MMETSP0439-20130205/12960_1 /TAXON_ID=0 /ORGANISM="Stereomyxa ramosa, Strain Chinc5" /LENGTH=340 /DNA_ID=CAMNT_0015347121 /DNA_START=62 /DNA_END=1084 /DNA_ORIENTATION=-
MACLLRRSVDVSPFVFLDESPFRPSAGATKDYTLDVVLALFLGGFTQKISKGKERATEEDFETEPDTSTFTSTPSPALPSLEANDITSLDDEVIEDEALWSGDELCGEEESYFDELLFDRSEYWEDQLAPKKIAKPKRVYPRERKFVNGPRQSLREFKLQLIREQMARRKDNIEDKVGTRRRGLKYFFARSGPPSSSTRNRKLDWNSPTWVEESDLRTACELNAQEVAACGLTYQQINEIGNRELTPEDYELLLALDESVEKKTVGEDVLSTFRKETFGELIQKQPDTDLACCSICLQEYEDEDVVMFLPCDHAFHLPCIETWLSFQSTNCPLDGLSLLA